MPSAAAGVPPTGTLLGGGGTLYVGDPRSRPEPHTDRLWQRFTLRRRVRVHALGAPGGRPGASTARRCGCGARCGVSLSATFAHERPAAAVLDDRCERFLLALVPLLPGSHCATAPCTLTTGPLHRMPAVPRCFRAGSLYDATKNGLRQRPSGTAAVNRVPDPRIRWSG